VIVFSKKAEGNALIPAQACFRQQSSFSRARTHCANAHGQHVDGLRGPASANGVVICFDPAMDHYHRLI
jgi:hypothetical protein